MNQDDGYFYEDWPTRRDKALLPGDVEGTAEQRRAILGAGTRIVIDEKEIKRVANPLHRKKGRPKSLPTLKVEKI